MKLSYYVYTEQQGENLIMYNCRTDAVVVLNKELQAVWGRYVPQHFASLQEVHPSLFNLLVNKKFLVDDALNEPSDFQAELREQDNRGDAYCIILNPTLNCNMRCWYCYEKHRSETRMSKKVCMAVLQLVKNKVQMEGLKELSLSFFGGEPLLEFDTVVFPILKECEQLCMRHNKHFNVSFTSNSYLLTEKILGQLRNLCVSNPISWQITIDGNRNVHNKVRHTTTGDGTYDIIVKNIHLLVENGMNVLVRLNYMYRNILSFLDIVNDFSDIATSQRNHIEFQFQKIWQDLDKIQNAQEGQSKIEKVENAMTQAGFRFTDKAIRPQRCYADDENSIVINYDGTLYNCTAQDFTDDAKEGVLSEDGKLVPNAAYSRRIQRKYDNQTCNSCKVYPLCYGNCIQHLLLRTEQNVCVKGWDDKKKLDVIRRRIKILIGNIK